MREYVESRPLPRLCVLKEVVSPVHVLLTDFLALASKSFEQKQRAKAATGQARTYIVLEAARGADVKLCMDELLSIICKNRLQSTVSLQCKYRAMRFCCASAALCCIHALLRLPRSGLPYQGFMLLEDASLAAAKKLLDTPACMKDEFFTFLCQSFASPEALLSVPAMGILECTALSLSVDISDIEASHSIVRDFINVHVKGWVSSLETLSSLHVLQQRRKFLELTSTRASGAKLQERQKPGPKPSAPKTQRRGGGGAWRAFVSKKLRGLKFRYRNDDTIFATLAGEYRGLSLEEKQRLSETGAAASFSHRKGYKAFGSAGGTGGQSAGRTGGSMLSRSDLPLQDAARLGPLPLQDAARQDFGLVPFHGGVSLREKYDALSRNLDSVKTPDPHALSAEEHQALSLTSEKGKTSSYFARSWEEHEDLASGLAGVSGVTSSCRKLHLDAGYAWTPPTEKLVKELLLG